MMKSETGFLKVCENGRYLTEAGAPFFWLADTAWLLFLRLSEDEIDTYLRNRKEKGFNVIQVVLVHSFPGSADKTASLPGRTSAGQSRKSKMSSMPSACRNQDDRILPDSRNRRLPW